MHIFLWRDEVSLQPNPDSRAMREIACWYLWYLWDYDKMYEAQIGMD